LFLLLLTACIIPPTPTVSPLPTPISPLPTESPLPTPPISPLPTAEARLDRSQETEKPELQPEEDEMTLPELLAMLAAGGLLGGIVSFLFERFKWFQNLSPDGRFWVVGVISVGLPVLATALILYVPAEVWAALEPFWQAVFAGGSAWLGGQFVHKRLK